MKIDKEIPPELLVPSRIAHVTMVAIMAASIDFTDKVQRERFEKAKRNAHAALGAIDFGDKVQRKRFKKQLYLKMKMKGEEEIQKKDDEEIPSNNLCILPDIRMKIPPELTVSPTNNYILPDIKISIEKTKAGISETDVTMEINLALILIS